MSQADRDRWDARYRNQTDAEANAASELLERGLARMAARRADFSGLNALDLACGSGRNALRLAEAGFRVDAVDVSAEGLALARRRAAQLLSGRADAVAPVGSRISWIQADLDDGLPVSGPYDLVVMIRYLNLERLADAIQCLNPDGVLIVELHMEPGRESVAGPGNPEFLLPSGALVEHTRNLTSWIHEEGVVQISSTRREALARYVGTNRSD